jgi:site-specific recombinase XerC
MPMKPAAAVRGPKHVVKTGKTLVLDAAKWRKLIDSTPTETVRDLRDRALIATLTYSFARITASANSVAADSHAACAVSNNERAIVDWTSPRGVKGRDQSVTPPAAC